LRSGHCDPGDDLRDADAEGAMSCPHCGHAESALPQSEMTLLNCVANLREDVSEARGVLKRLWSRDDLGDVGDAAYEFLKRTFDFYEAKP